MGHETAKVAVAQAGSPNKSMMKKGEKNLHLDAVCSFFVGTSFASTGKAWRGRRDSDPAAHAATENLADVTD
jgi:hypothetical protein